MDSINQTEKPGLRRLFFSMLYISAFTFGGGFVIVTFMRRKFVEELGWFTDAEMLDISALAQSAPGAIAVNAAILVGWRLAGLRGMLTAVLGTILPPMVLLTAISYCYEAFAANPWVAALLGGTQAAVAAVILDAAWTMGCGVVRTRKGLPIALLVAAFAAACIFRINAVAILIAAALIGVIWAAFCRRKERRA